MSVLMLNRPRPHLQLAAFLAGGFPDGPDGGRGGAVGGGVPVCCRPHISPCPWVQMVIGTLALAAALVVATTKGTPHPTGVAPAGCSAGSRCGSPVSPARVSRCPRSTIWPGAGRDRGGQHRRVDPARRPGGLQRRGVRAGWRFRCWPGGPAAHAGRDDRPAPVDPHPAPPRGRGAAGRRGRRAGDGRTAGV